MPICYLHIGPNKTATKTLQACLEDNAVALADDGFYVPGLGAVEVPRFHHSFAAEMGGDPATFYRDRMAMELRAAGYPERIVISAERLSAWLHLPEKRDALLRYFANLGYQVRVIAYVRPQIVTINAFYSQRVKNALGAGTFDAFFNSFLAHPRFEHGWRLQPVADDPNMNTTLVPFSSVILRDGVCSDFLQRLGVDRAKFSRYVFPEARNVSPGPKTVAAFALVGEQLRRRNIQLSRAVAFHRAESLRRRTEAMGWDKVRFNGLEPNHKERLLAHFGPKNEAFARRNWQVSWRDYFADDEEQALKDERRCFDLAVADAGERAEFEDFCRLAFEVMSRPLES